MRINVYAEEMTDEAAEVITKTVVPDGQTDAVTFYGIRFYLKSPDELHHAGDDDDRSAITLWAKWTKKGGNDFYLLRRLAEQMGIATGMAWAADSRNRSTGTEEPGVFTV